MNFSLKQSLAFFCLLLAYLIGYYGAYCGTADSCLGLTEFREGAFTFFKPLWVFSLYAMPGAFFLPFVSSRVYDLWLRFALAWVLLTVFLVAMAPEAMNGWFYLFRSAKTDVALYAGVSFSFLTIFLLPIATLAYYSRSKGYN